MYAVWEFPPPPPWNFILLFSGGLRALIHPRCIISTSVRSNSERRATCLTQAWSPLMCMITSSKQWQQQVHFTNSTYSDKKNNISCKYILIFLFSVPHKLHYKYCFINIKLYYQDWCYDSTLLKPNYSSYNVAVYVYIWLSLIEHLDRRYESCSISASLIVSEPKCKQQPIMYTS